MPQTSKPDQSNVDSTIGPLMIDIEGQTLTEEDRNLLDQPLVGGLILFTRNYSNIPQLKHLITEIRACNANIVIAVDHEGGRVQRFREGFSHLPPMAVLGRRFKTNPEQALQLSKELGWLMAAELLCLDIDISFAPVMDREYGVSQVIGDRAFSESPEEIIRLSAAFIEGMHEAGMASTGKHFPGHGYVAADSHVDIPIDPRSKQDIFQNDMRIFSEMVSKGMDAVMPAHVIYDQVDTKPAGFSKIWVQNILREQLSFDGVVFSDDLSMEGATVAGSFSQRAEAALNAGCDMILVCNHRMAAQEVLGSLDQFQAPAASGKRLARLKGKSKIAEMPELQALDRWKEINKKICAFKEKGESSLWIF